jgi:uncharacterized membrane protein
LSEDVGGVPKFAKDRAQNLTDGIFATVMTILVLSLVVPVISGPNVSTELLSDLVKTLPNVLTYVMSFLVLGVPWIGHNNIFRHITHPDRHTQWFNLVFLLCLGFVPFTTALLGRYPLEQITLVIYGLNMLVLAIIFNMFWLHTTKAMTRQSERIDLKYLRAATKRNFIGIFIYIAGIIFAFVAPEESLGIYVLMPAYYIIMGIIYYK